MADGQAAEDAATALQVATCAEVTAKLSAGVSADEAAALCSRLADLLDLSADIYFCSDAMEGLRAALLASQREHAAHAGVQEASESSTTRDAMIELLFSAARAHLGVASLQCQVWKVFSCFQEMDDDDDSFDESAYVQRAQAKLEAEHSCVICLDAPRSVGLLPCRHLLLCDSAACATMLGAPPLCPTCREPVADIVRLFV